MVNETSRFDMCLLGKPSHDALLKMQDHELKFLEVSICTAAHSVSLIYLCAGSSIHYYGPKIWYSIIAFKACIFYPTVLNLNPSAVLMFGTVFLAALSSLLFIMQYNIFIAYRLL